MRIFSYAFALAILTISAAVAQGRPDPAPAQKAGMEKLRFLAGTWSGPTTVSQAGKEIRIQQTEERKKPRGPGLVTNPKRECQIVVYSV